jgi:hypothetical protein
VRQQIFDRDVALGRLSAPDFAALEDGIRRVLDLS